MTKAMAYASSLAGHWHLPWESPAGAVQAQGGFLGVQSVMDGCLPVLLMVVMALRLMDGFESLPSGRSYAFQYYHKLVWNGLSLEKLRLFLQSGKPIVAAVAAAGGYGAAGFGELGMLAGALAGSISCARYTTVVVSALAGSLAGQLCPALLSIAARLGVPATASSIAAGGGAGLAVGVTIMASPLPYWCTYGGFQFRNAVGYNDELAYNSTWTVWVLGAVMGWLTFLGCRRGRGYIGPQRSAGVGDGGTRASVCRGSAALASALPPLIACVIAGPLMRRSDSNKQQ